MLPQLRSLCLLALLAVPSTEDWPLVAPLAWSDGGPDYTPRDRREWQAFVRRAERREEDIRGASFRGARVCVGGEITNGCVVGSGSAGQTIGP